MSAQRILECCRKHATIDHQARCSTDAPFHFRGISGCIDTILLARKFLCRRRRHDPARAHRRTTGRCRLRPDRGERAPSCRARRGGPRVDEVRRGDRAFLGTGGAARNGGRTQTGGFTSPGRPTHPHPQRGRHLRPRSRGRTPHRRRVGFGNTDLGCTDRARIRARERLAGIVVPSRRDRHDRAHRDRVTARTEPGRALRQGSPRGHRDLRSGRPLLQ